MLALSGRYKLFIGKDFMISFLKEFIKRLLNNFTPGTKLIDVNQFLNCCSNPNLQTIKTIYSSSHDAEWLDRCVECSSYWFRRFHEWENWSGGSDDLTTYYTRISDQESKIIISANNREELNLSYLEKRESIVDENGNISVTKGQPSYPYR